MDLSKDFILTYINKCIYEVSDDAIPKKFKGLDTALRITMLSRCSWRIINY
jgi:hypothetical protein